MPIQCHPFKIHNKLSPPTIQTTYHRQCKYTYRGTTVNNNKSIRMMRSHDA